MEASAHPATFRIARTRVSVLVGLLGLLACLAFAFLAFLLAVLPFVDPASADVPYLVRLAALLFALAIAWLGVWILRYSLGRWTRGQVDVGPGRLTIHHADTFRAPLQVPRSAIRLALVDVHGAGLLGDHQQVARGSYDERLPWAQLPFVSSHQDLELPNVGLLFHEPVPAPPVRHPRLHGPLQGEALAGLRLRVEDVEGLERRLTAWGCVREPPEADATHADRLLGRWEERSPANARRPLWLDRLARTGWLMVPASLMVPWVLPVSVAAALILISRRRWAGWAMLPASAAAAYLAFGIMR